jgi:uncharacterized protein (DUF1499 family)
VNLRGELRTTFCVNDGEFLLDRERQVIQVRSASRPGYSDLSKNRCRLEGIRKQFVTSLTGGRIPPPLPADSRHLFIANPAT